MNDLKKNTGSVARVLLGINNQSLMVDFLEDLLTPAEITSISERLRVMNLLIKGDSQRVVAGKLKCSISTVTRGSKIIQFGKQSIRKVLK
jgi:TrpR family transcriptional regulator, trp operon repressor